MTDTPVQTTREQSPRRSWSLVTWDLAQRGLAAVMLVALAPVMLACAAVVASTSPGPVLFVQERPGLRGARLRVVKFRTMSVGADLDPRNQLAVTRSHPQVTRAGRVLRALKLDELPQLWSVVKGEMSLVGPRPIGDGLDALLRDRLPGFAQRNHVRPGLTSLGQVCSLDNFPADQLLEDWSFRSACELHYVRHRSVRYDLLILAMTAILLARKTLGVTSGLLRWMDCRQWSARPGPFTASASSLRSHQG